jgi:hypothetical protein
LHAAIEQSLAEIDAGKTIPFSDLISSLRAKRTARGRLLRRSLHCARGETSISIDRWISEHGFDADNPLFEEISHAAELLCETPELGIVYPGQVTKRCVACYCGLGGTSTTRTIKDARSS